MRRSYHQQNKKRRRINKRFISYYKARRNPYYSRALIKRRPGSLRKKIALILFWLTLGFWCYLLFFSPYFEIKEIKVQTDENIGEKEVQEMTRSQLAESRFWFLDQNNIFLYDTDELQETLRQNFILENLNIEKKSWQTLLITLAEKNPSIIYREGEWAYLVDSEGLIIRKAGKEKINNSALPVVEQEKNILPDASNAKSAAENPLDEAETGSAIISLPLPVWNPKEKIMPAEEVAFIAKIHASLLESKQQPSSYLLSSDDDITIKAKTQQGWQAFFNLQNEAEVQIKNLNLVLKEKIEDAARLDYIDLRFGDKVNYKYR